MRHGGMNGREKEDGFGLVCPSRKRTESMNPRSSLSYNAGLGKASPPVVPLIPLIPAQIRGAWSSDFGHNRVST